MKKHDTIAALMKDTETFRQKVIDAGIRGKLTKQLPEDGNAEDLYQQIQAEKAKLIKGKSHFMSTFLKMTNLQSKCNG